MSWEAINTAPAHVRSAHETRHQGLREAGQAPLLGRLLGQLCARFGLGAAGVSKRVTPRGPAIGGWLLPHILTGMSRPPFLELPPGVRPVDLPTARVAGLLAEPLSPARGDVLLVPGFTGSKEDFIAVLRPLADLGWRVLALSLPGQGGVPGLGPRGSHTIAALGAAVGRAAQWLGDQAVHLVGHSMGGLVTRQLVLTEPAKIASWTLMCSGPGALPEQRWPELVALISAVDQGVPLEAIWQAQLAADRAAGSLEPPGPIRDFLHGRFVGNDPSSLADFAQILMTEPDRSAEIAELRAARSGRPPIAVLTGAADDAWPVAVQEQLAARWNVPFIVLATGHSPAAEAPWATASALSDIFSGQ